VFAVSKENTALIWDVRNGQSLREAPRRLTQSASFTLDGTLIATDSLSSRGADVWGIAPLETQ